MRCARLAAACAVAAHALQRCVDGRCEREREREREGEGEGGGERTENESERVTQVMKSRYGAAVMD